MAPSIIEILYSTQGHR